MQIEVTETERNQIRYALEELANRRAEQSIDRKSVADGNESRELRALAERIGRAVVLMAACVMLLGGCDDGSYWKMEYAPQTPEERQCVAKLEAEILSQHHSDVRGWDDAIKAAHEAARETCCQPMMWEYRSYSRTGVHRPIGGGAQ